MNISNLLYKKAIKHAIFQTDNRRESIRIRKIDAKVRHIVCTFRYFPSYAVRLSKTACRFFPYAKKGSITFSYMCQIRLMSVKKFRTGFVLIRIAMEENAVFQVLFKLFHKIKLRKWKKNFSWAQHSLSKETQQFKKYVVFLPLKLLKSVHHAVRYTFLASSIKFWKTSKKDSVRFQPPMHTTFYVFLWDSQRSQYSLTVIKYANKRCNGAIIAWHIQNIYAIARCLNVNSIMHKSKITKPLMQMTYNYLWFSFFHLIFIITSHSNLWKAVQPKNRNVDHKNRIIN